MRILVDYCFMEVQMVAESYSIHNGVYDWILAGLNKVVDARQYWYAFDLAGHYHVGRYDCACLDLFILLKSVGVHDR